MKKLSLIMFFVITSLLAVAQTWNPEQKCHFSGLEIGFNRYTSPSSSGYQDLSLNTGKSMYFKLNVLNGTVKLYEKQNKNRYDSQMLFTYIGFGVKWNNYVFDKDVRLTKQDNILSVYRDNTSENIKSKLTISWLNIPLMLEYQLNYNWFITAGTEFGFKMGSHTKYVYRVDDKKKKDKNRDDLGINKFKTDLVCGIGFSRLSLNLCYSLTPLFKENVGPEIFPYSINLLYSFGR